MRIIGSMAIVRGMRISSAVAIVGTVTATMRIRLDLDGVQERRPGHTATGSRVLRPVRGIGGGATFARMCAFRGLRLTGRGCMVGIRGVAIPGIAVFAAFAIFTFLSGRFGEERVQHRNVDRAFVVESTRRRKTAN